MSVGIVMSWRVSLKRSRFSALAETTLSLQGLLRRKTLFTYAKKVLTFLVLVGFCASSIPLPIARISLPEGESAVPFPCQYCGCGCKSALKCWTSCCCFTPSQRLAWAKQNGVTPPDYAILADDQSTSSSIAASGESCCVTKKTCCAAKKACCAVKSKDSVPKVTTWSTPRTKMVLTLCALKCQGASSDFTLLPWTILVREVTLNCRRFATGERTPLDSWDVPSHSLQPELPPPKAYGAGMASSAT